MPEITEMNKPKIAMHPKSTKMYGQINQKLNDRAAKHGKWQKNTSHP